ncbi:MAG: pyridine nucleotide-disulfide oxidoreductase, partial [Candidatus Accumulibacter sp. UW26]
MQMRKWLLVLALTSVVGLYLALDLGQYLNLQTLKAQQQAIEAYRTDNPGLSVALYFSAYVVMAALSLPGAALLTLAGGAVFGLLW